MEWELHRVARNEKSSVKSVDNARESHIMSGGSLCINLTRSNYKRPVVTQQSHSHRATSFSGPFPPNQLARGVAATSAAHQQGTSVIQPPQTRGAFVAPAFATAAVATRKSSRFKASWLEAFSWLQYDRSTNVMYCKYCRKWSDTIPEIRTSFAAGNGNFRLEIINHHDKCKAHNLCVTKETEQIVTKYENYY